MARNFEQPRSFMERRAVRVAGVLAAIGCVVGTTAGCQGTVKQLRSDGNAVKGKAREFEFPVPATGIPVQIKLDCRDHIREADREYPQRVIVDGKKVQNSTWTVEATTYFGNGNLGKAGFFASARYLVPPSDTAEYSAGPGLLGSDHGHHQPYPYEDLVYESPAFPDGTTFRVETTTHIDELAFTCGDLDTHRTTNPIRTEILEVKFPQQEEQ